MPGELLAECLVSYWHSVRPGCCCGDDGKWASAQGLSSLLLHCLSSPPQVLSCLLFPSPSLCKGRVCLSSFSLGVNMSNCVASPKTAVLDFYLYCDPQAKNTFYIVTQGTHTYRQIKQKQASHKSVLIQIKCDVF